MIQGGFRLSWHRGEKGRVQRASILHVVRLGGFRYQADLRRQYQRRVAPDCRDGIAGVAAGDRQVRDAALNQD